MTQKIPGRPVPIGREPVPAALDPWSALSDPLPGVVLPQVATLDGTILRVGPRRCDLALVGGVRMRTASSVMSWFARGGEYSAEYLEVHPDRAAPPIRLVITFYAKCLYRPEHLRLLAGILSDRTWQPGRTGRRAQRAIASLKERADLIDWKNRPTDWSFRAGPMSDRRKSPGNYT
jgi:hypothetical protein